VTALLARIAQAFRSLPAAGTTVAVVLSGVLALAIAGPLVYRAVDDGGGGGGGETTTAAGPESDANGNGNGNGNGRPDGDGVPDTVGPPPDGAGSGGSGTGGGPGTGGGGSTGGTDPGDAPPPGEVPPPGGTLPPPTTPPTTNPPVTPEPVLLVSKEPNRAGAVPLDGARLGGLVHPFVTDKNQATDRVDFFLDDPDMKGAPFSSDAEPEFDFCGTDRLGLAIPFNTLAVAIGSHVITAKVTGTGGTTVVVSAKVQIENIIPPLLPPVLPPICGLPIFE
jgi:hypothetical protein